MFIRIKTWHIVFASFLISCVLSYITKTPYIFFEDEYRKQYFIIIPLVGIIPLLVLTDIFTKDLRGGDWRDKSRTLAPIVAIGAFMGILSSVVAGFFVS
jgi:hypothetical protein